VNEQQHSQLLDLIYGAAVDPGLWITVMEKIADLMGGNTAWLSQVSMADGNGSGIIARIDPVMPQRYIDYYAGLNPFAVKARPQEAIANFKPKITTDRDDFPDDGLERTEFFNDFMRPQDIRSVMMIDVAAKGLEVATVNIHRNGRTDPFGEEQLRIAEALLPHLVRAFRLGGAFADLKSLADDTAAALDRAGNQTNDLLAIRLVSRAYTDDAAVPEHDHSVCHFEDVLQVVSDEDDGATTGHASIQ